MRYSAYTDVILKDGKEGTIIEVFDDAYFVEIDPPTNNANVWDCILTVTDDDILRAVHRRGTHDRQSASNEDL